MNELFNVNQRLHNFLTKQQKAGGNTTDENRSIGTQATLNNKDVYWSGQNYGWQSQDSYNKLKEGPEFRAGHIASTRFGTDVNQAINMGVDALPEQVKFTALDVVRQGVQLYQGLPQGIRTGINNVGQGLADVNELVSKTTNISPIITAEALTAAGTAGVGNVVKKATTGMNVVDNLRNTVALAAKPGFDYYAVTINNPKVLNTTGRRLGEEIIKNEPGLAEHLVKRDKRMQQLENKITQNLEVKKVYKKEGKANPEWKSADRAVKKSRPLLYSERSNVKPFTDDDFQLYGVNNAKTDRNQLDWMAQRKKKGLQISEKIHKHHLVTKGGTSAAFEKMEDFIKKGKADPDDLVVMFEYAEKKGVAPGDRLSNNAYIQDTPHSQIHQQVLKPAGDEFSQKQWASVLKEVKTPEELMDWWVDQVDNNYVPNKNTGLIWQDLDDLIKEVQST